MTGTMSTRTQPLRADASPSGEPDAFVRRYKRNRIDQR